MREKNDSSIGKACMSVLLLSLLFLPLSQGMADEGTGAGAGTIPATITDVPAEAAGTDAETGPGVGAGMGAGAGTAEEGAAGAGVVRGWSAMAVVGLTTRIATSVVFMMIF